MKFYKTVINRCGAHCRNGLLFPVLVSERIRSYQLTELSKNKADRILKSIEKTNGNFN